MVNKAVLDKKIEIIEQRIKIKEEELDTLIREKKILQYERGW